MEPNSVVQWFPFDQPNSLGMRASSKQCCDPSQQPASTEKQQLQYKDPSTSQGSVEKEHCAPLVTTHGIRQQWKEYLWCLVLVAPLGHLFLSGTALAPSTESCAGEKKRQWEQVDTTERGAFLHGQHQQRRADPRHSSLCSCQKWWCPWKKDKTVQARCQKQTLMWIFLFSSLPKEHVQISNCSESPSFFGKEVFTLWCYRLITPITQQLNWAQ